MAVRRRRRRAGFHWGLTCASGHLGLDAARFNWQSRDQVMKIPLSNSRPRFFALMLALLCSFSVAVGADGPGEELHKVEVHDAAVARRLTAQGGRVVADYGTYQLIETAAVDPESVADGSGEARDEYNF